MSQVRFHEPRPKWKRDLDYYADFQNPAALGALRIGLSQQFFCNHPAELALVFRPPEILLRLAVRMIAAAAQSNDPSTGSLPVA
jgi:hypothetical protein